MSAFTANADYEEVDRQPMRLRAGDEVTVGPVDRAWPGWVWASDDSERCSYVPEDFLEPLGEGRFAAMRDYDSRVLRVKRGDRLTSILTVHGWHWCRNARDEEGWLPAYLLKVES